CRSKRRWHVRAGVERAGVARRESAANARAAARASGRAGRRPGRWQSAYDRAHAPAAALLALAHFDRVTDAVAEDGLRDRRLVRDDVVSEMMLAVAEDPVRRRLTAAFEALEDDFGPEPDHAL